jgi:hypothetical protein
MTEPLAPPEGPPPGWETAPPHPRRRRRWVWVLVGVVTLIVALFGVGIGLFITIQKPVIDAASAFLDDVADGDYGSAYAELCEEDRDALSEEGFAEFARTEPTLARLDDPSVNFLGVDINGDEATVDFDPEAGENSDDTDFDESYELELQKEDGDWRVCGLAGGTSA